MNAGIEQMSEMDMTDAALQIELGKGRSTLLSGLGYYKLSRKRRKMLMYIFGGALVVQSIALMAVWGWTIMQQRNEEVVIFRTPPPARRYEPRKLEHKVKVQKQQRSSSRPAMMPRMVSMRMSDLSLPEVKVDPKVIHTTFQPKFRAVSGRGLGAGLGTGHGTHGFGSGVANMNFFGLRARGEKVAILLDVSLSMVEDVRGGVKGFQQVKRRMNEVIDALPETALFNVVAFADAASAMNGKLEMVIANEGNKRRAKDFIRPFNQGEGHWGLDQSNIQPNPGAGLRAEGGTTRLDMALNAAYMMGADVILVFCDGLPMVRKGYTQEQLNAHQQRLTQWNAENAARVAAWQQNYAAAQANAQQVTEKVWVPERPAVPARPAVPPRPPSKRPPKEGQPPDRGHPGSPAQPAQPARPGYWTTRTVTRGGYSGPPRPQPPALGKPGNWTLADFVTHLNMLHEALYKERGQKPPQIHAIGYIIDDKGHTFLNGLAREFKGQYRRISKLR
jgi:hypothetical protein